MAPKITKKPQKKSLLKTEDSSKKLIKY